MSLIKDLAAREGERRKHKAGYKSLWQHFLGDVEPLNAPEADQAQFVAHRLARNEYLRQQEREDRSDPPLEDAWRKKRRRRRKQKRWDPDFYHSPPDPEVLRRAETERWRQECTSRGLDPDTMPPAPEYATPADAFIVLMLILIAFLGILIYGTHVGVVRW